MERAKFRKWAGLLALVLVSVSLTPMALPATESAAANDPICGSETELSGSVIQHCVRQLAYVPGSEVMTPDGRLFYFEALGDETPTPYHFCAVSSDMKSDSCETSQSGDLLIVASPQSAVVRNDGKIAVLVEQHKTIDLNDVESHLHIWDPNTMKIVENYTITEDWSIAETFLFQMSNEVFMAGDAVSQELCSFDADPILSANCSENHIYGDWQIGFPFSFQGSDYFLTAGNGTDNDPTLYRIYDPNDSGTTVRTPVTVATFNQAFTGVTNRIVINQILFNQAGQLCMISNQVFFCLSNDLSDAAFTLDLTTIADYDDVSDLIQAPADLGSNPTQDSRYFFYGASADDPPIYDIDIMDSNNPSSYTRWSIGENTVQGYFLADNSGIFHGPDSGLYTFMASAIDSDSPIAYIGKIRRDPKQASGYALDVVFNFNLNNLFYSIEQSPGYFQVNPNKTALFLLHSALNEPASGAIYWSEKISAPKPTPTPTPTDNPTPTESPTPTQSPSASPSPTPTPEPPTPGSSNIINKIPSATGPALAFTDTKSKGITKARASAIEWLARTGVTEGFGCSGSNAACEYKPNNSVTRGAMAQYFQRLAGWTDAQVAAVYANKSNSFTDISGLTAERRLAIMWLADTGITKGCDPDGSQYCPSKVVNRGAMAEFMQKFAGVKPVETKTSVFPDVSAQSVKVQYDDSKTASQVPAQPLNRIAAINWLSSNKITQGFGTNSAGKTVFRPSAPVTRGAMAEFMQRLASKMTPKTSG